MLTQSKRITQLDCIIFLRFWLAQIVYILVLVSVTNTRAAVIQKREIPTSYPQKDGSDTLLDITKEMNRRIEINEPKLIALITTEFPLNETYKNDRNRKLDGSLPKATYNNLLHNTESNVESTSRGDFTVTELSYNDINAKYEVANSRYQNEHNNLKSEKNRKALAPTQSKETVKIFDNDVLQILRAVNKEDLTTSNSLRTEDTTKNSKRQIKNEASPSAVEIKTEKTLHSNHDTTLNSLDVQQPTTEVPTNIRESPTQITQNGKDFKMKILNSVQDNGSREILKNLQPIRDTVSEITTIRNKITEGILFDLDNMQVLTTLPTIAIATNKFDNTTSNYSILDSAENRQDHQYDKSLGIHDNFTLQILKNINENEIISTTPTFTKLGAEYMANKKKNVVPDKSTTEKATTKISDSTVDKRGKYINNNSTVIEQINLPSAAEVWTLVGMKAGSKINANITMGTTHEYFSKINKSEQQSSTLNGHNSGKAILDWTQIMSTNELMDKKIEITTEHKNITASIPVLPSPSNTFTTTSTFKIMKNEVALNETSTNPMKILLHRGELSKYNNVSSLSAKQNVENMNLSVSDNSEEKQITSPISLENNSENFIETNIGITTVVTPTSQTGTEIKTETTLTTLSTATSEEMRLSKKKEITIHPLKTSAENAMVLNKVEKVEQRNNEEQLRWQQQKQMNVENDANTTIKNIMDDAVTEALITTTITAFTSVDTFTLEPILSDTTTFSTLLTGGSSASVLPPVFTVDTSTQKNFINNQNNDTTTTIKTNSGNVAAPTNSLINNANKIYQEGTADIERYTHLKKTEKNQITNLATNFIGTVNATTTTNDTTTIENNFNSSVLESRVITQEAETTTKALKTTATPTSATTVNSTEFFSTLLTVTEREAATITTLSITNTEVTPTGNESTSFPLTKSILINQGYSNEYTGEETSRNITPNETALSLNINEIKPTTQAALTTTRRSVNIITTITEKTPDASSNIEHSLKTSIETNIIDNNNNNTEAKEDDADIGKTITYTTTPITITTSEKVTESNYNIYNGNDNVLMMTTMSTVITLNNATTNQMTIVVGHNDSTETKTAIVATRTTKSEPEMTLPPTRLIPKIEEIYDVIQYSTTEKSLQETTTLSQPITLSTNEQNLIVSSTSRNITNISSIVKESTVLPRPTVINIHQTDINENKDGIVEGGDGSDVGDIIFPTLRTIKNDERHLYPPKASDTIDETDVNVIIAITVSVIGVVALVLLLAFLYLMRKRQKSLSYSQRCRPVSLDDYAIDSTSIYNSIRSKSNTVRASKRSHANLGFDDPSLRHNVLDVNELGKFLQDKCSIYEEFRDVPQVRARVDEVPSGCEDKNRYANVVPLPETRVMLQRLNNDTKTEYINANYVRGPKDTIKYYIACQAPLDSTIEDFWRMIWEQKSRVIIQATDLVENGVEKCAEYLPPSITLDNHTTFGEFQVTLHHREVKDKYATSIILLKHIGENVTREITHYWYKWPEVGVPLEEAPIIAMLLEARSSLISYAIEYASEIKGDASTITLKSTEDSSAATINGANDQTKDKDSANNTMNNTKEINGNISMVHIKKKTTKYQGPLTVHCSPGTGRTGTIIACDIAIRSLEMPKRTVDIPQIVYYVRHCRASSILTKEQYEFIYKVANMYASKITNPSNDN